MTDRDRLRELAEATLARRGHIWRLRRSTFGRQYAYVEWDKPSEGLGTGTLDREDAKYIAAASPDVILALLDDLAAAEERVRVLLSYADGMAHDLWADWEQEGGPLTSREEWEKVRGGPTVCGRLADGEPGRCHRHFRAALGAAQEKGEAG